MTVRLLTKLLPSIWATLLAAGAASLMVIAIGGSPLEVFRLFLGGTLFSGYGLGQVLFKTTPLIFTGLAVAVGLQAGLFNIGVEGQLIAGAFAMALFGAHLPPATSALVAIPLCLLVGFAVGAAAGALPGLLKAWRGSHEVITTIMLNFVIRAAMVGAGAHTFVKESLHTLPIVRAAELPRLGRIWPRLHGSAASAALLLALVAVLSTEWLIARTRLGFELRAFGRAPLAAEASGLLVKRTTVIAMMLSGGIAGLAGASFVLGYKHYFEDGFSGGIGYMGIAVAVLGRAEPLGVVVAALVFGTLSQGALAVNAVVPKELVDVLQAFIIFSVLGASQLIVRALRSSKTRVA